LFSQYRSTRIEKGVLSKHQSFGGTSDVGKGPISRINDTVVVGSSLVRIGGENGPGIETTVLATVSVQVGTCVVSSSDTTTAASSGKNNSLAVEGDVQVSLSSTSLSNDDNSSFHCALQSYLERLLRDSLDLTQLAIRPIGNNPSGGISSDVNENKAFLLSINVQILQDGGNVRDACILACTAALDDTRLPNTTTIDNAADDRIWLVQSDVPRRRLQLPILPVPLTCGIWVNDKKEDMSVTGETSFWIVDPTRVEQDCCSSLLTIVVDGNSAKPGGNSSLSILSVELIPLETDPFTRRPAALTVQDVASSGVLLDPSMIVLASKLASGRVGDVRDCWTRNK